jgi:hypothetical protein
LRKFDNPHLTATELCSGAGAGSRGKMTAAQGDLSCDAVRLDYKVIFRIA